MLGKLHPDQAGEQLTTALATAEMQEKKAILTSLGDLQSPRADATLAKLLDELRAGKIAPEVQLELLEAAAKRHSVEVKTALAAYEAAVPADNLMAQFAPALAGGDRAIGEKLFKEHAVAQCFRCHKVGGSGGDAGPDLTNIGSLKDRKYLLESIIAPNAQIAEGFQSLLVTLKNGEMQMGVPRGETADELTLQMPAPGVPAVKVKKAEIQSKESAPSGMPAMGQLLTKREIRDILEYIATLKK
jgi:quinoprotein glucose dehydrogenase